MDCLKQKPKHINEKKLSLAMEMLHQHSQWHKLLYFGRAINSRGGGVDSWVSFCWVCAAGFSEPLPHFSKIQLVVYYQCCILIG